MSKVIAIYCDGGLIGSNPSTIGGTWAWCHVDKHGKRIAKKSGVLLPQPGFTCSNNDTELEAALRGLEALTGPVKVLTLFTDSWVTICRLVNNGSGLVNEIQERIRKAKAHWPLELVLLGGHPTKKELKVGRRKDGKPVSVHNVWCDKACTRRADEYKEANCERV